MVVKVLKVLQVGEGAAGVQMQRIDYKGAAQMYTAMLANEIQGTNLQHALALSRHLMRGEKGSKQVIVVTDGEPTAHLLENGQPFFNWPPVYETLHATMAEVLRSTRAGITINTFALDIERSQFPFVEQIAKVNGGRTFYTDVDNLGRYVLDDFVRSRKSAPLGGLHGRPRHDRPAGMRSWRSTLIHA